VNVAVAALAFGFYLWRWLRIEFDSTRLWGDVTCCWEPLGYAVLNGASIYTAPVTIDNKPPLWHFVAIVGAWVGDVGLVILLVDGLAAMALVYLTTKFIGRIVDDERATAIGAVATFTIIIQIAYMSNNKLPAAALLFAAAYLRKPLYSGVLAGASVWISQYTGLAIVSLGLLFLFTNDDRKPFVKYVLGGVAITALIWGVVGVVWGMDSVIGGVKAAFFVAEGYANESTSPFENPGEYLHFADQVISTIYLQLLFALAGVGVVLSDRLRFDQSGWEEITALGFVTLPLLPMFLFRFYRHYFSFYVVPLSVCIAIFFASLLDDATG